MSVIEYSAEQRAADREAEENAPTSHQFDAQPEPASPAVEADIEELAEIAALVESVGDTPRLQERRAAIEARAAAREKLNAAECSAAEKAIAVAKERLDEAETRWTELTLSLAMYATEFREARLQYDAAMRVARRLGISFDRKPSLSERAAASSEEGRELRQARDSIKGLGVPFDPSAREYA
jgi:hypothetical protein